MAKINFCKQGGQNGILLQDTELTELANYIDSRYLDEYIPLPNTILKEQKLLISECKEIHTNASSIQYWETNTGSHGWCCAKCGKVIQWG